VGGGKGEGMNEAWLINQTSDDCVYCWPEKRTKDPYFKCKHKQNKEHLCNIEWCPIKIPSKKIRGPFDICPLCEQEIPEGRPALYVKG